MANSRLSILFFFICIRSFSQMQTCPVNINFTTGDLSHWFAYTGNNRAGNGPDAIMKKYDSGANSPTGTRGARTITEYNLSSVTGISVITSKSVDQFGGFSTIPTINGYSYDYSILLGSTAVTRGNNMTRTGGGGYVRGVSYNIKVPPGPATVPYTMTYAYAMVLENGTHVSSQQPMISVTLKSPSGVISCASPSYLLPTDDRTTEGERGATLDTATAIKNGFKLSPRTSPNPNMDRENSTTEYLQDIWTKDWTEVTFDLAAYRGQQVSLTFEADNCVPGGHFAYGYLAVRNNCAGLEISGDSLLCYNAFATYSVPALAEATYNWVVPDSWQLLSSDTGNTIHVRAASIEGSVSVREKNSCADLSASIKVKTVPSPVGGTLEGSTTVCAGENSNTLNLVDYSGTIIKWLSSTDSVTWTEIFNSSPQYTAENLGSTTLYKAVVEKGTVCPPDSSKAAIITVDQKTIGGRISPSEATLCLEQPGQTLLLTDYKGTVLNWQYTTDEINWSDFDPVNSSSTFVAKDITVSTRYRAIDKNGVCPADTSSIARITFNPVAFPQAEISPSDTTVCFRTEALLFARINRGTSYAWSAGGSGSVTGTPYDISSRVSPDSATDYILQVFNYGCPNPLEDTFHVKVYAPVLVNAGRDTNVVAGQPLQFQAYTSDTGSHAFLWSPPAALSDPSIADPVGTYALTDNVIRYEVKVTTALGCTGQDSITVKVFKTKPDIFVPNAFTPGRGTNAIFRPIPVGISSLQYFRVYNRLGQLVYSTSNIGNGWDGQLNGVPQASGGYVWMAKGTDYSGNTIIRNGMMVLIR